MEARTFFGGRAWIKPLQVIDQPAQRTEVCARLASPRGELVVLTDGADPIRHLAYVELKAGMLRGNHYHKLRHETFYLIQGEVTVTMGDIATGETETAQMRGGDMAYFDPCIAHAFRPSIGGHGIEYAPEPFDTGDVYPHQLV